MDELASLLDLANSTEWQERVCALYRLGEIDDPRARAAIVLALHDTDNTAITEAAVDVMVRHAQADDASALLGALKSDDEEAAEHVALFLRTRASAGSSFSQAVLDQAI